MTTQWANIGDDPGALHALVASITERVPVEQIERVWIFPTRKIAVGESTVVVVAGTDEAPERRRVFTAHFTVTRSRKGAAHVATRFDEHATAPADALPRVVDGVLRRLGEDATAEPREEEIAGESDRWNGLIVELGGTLPAAEEETGVDADSVEEVVEEGAAEPEVE